MAASFTIRTASGEVVARHSTDRLLVAASMNRELQDRYPGHEIDVTFHAA